MQKILLQALFHLPLMYAGSSSGAAFFNKSVMPEGNIPKIGLADKRPDGKDFALFFAVETYDNPSSWSKLPGLVDECRAIGRDLQTLYGFEPAEVVVNPSLDEIDLKLAEYRGKKFGPDDQLFIYFSGHGEFLESSGQGFFIPRDGKSSKVSKSERRWYSLLDMPREVTTIKCRHIFLAIDACYSGTIDYGVALKSKGDEEWAAPIIDPEKSRAEYIHNRLREQSRFLMTSGGKNKTRNPSDFARSFRKTLDSFGGPDGMLEPHDFQEDWPKTGDYLPQSGIFEGHDQSGYFIFSYQKGKKPPPQQPVDSDFDEDGTPDNLDKCPQDKGLAVNLGCPETDTDGDGILDKNDKCPGQKGTVELKGCPDSDGDGVADQFDVCPDEKGLSTNRGCPEKLVEKSGLSIPEMILIIGGDFEMGGNNGDRDEKPVHEVHISTFMLGKHEVTQAEWVAVMGNNPSHFKGDNLPVENVSWDEVQVFINKLNSKKVSEMMLFRLPTEAEWEFAAKDRGLGTYENYSLGDLAWHFSNSSGITHPIGQKMMSNIKIHDLLGNVYEWCSDYYGAYKPENQTNPTGPATGTTRVVRGGSWGDGAENVRPENRGNHHPGSGDKYIGFRLAADYEK